MQELTVSPLVGGCCRTGSLSPFWLRNQSRTDGLPLGCRQQGVSSCRLATPCLWRALRFTWRLSQPPPHLLLVSVAGAWV